MRVYGLKSSAKNLGWLVGLSFFLLAILFPPLPTTTLYYIGNSLNRDMANWVYTFFYTGAFGALAWRIEDYMQWQAYVHAPATGRLLFESFAAYCFVPVALPICSLIAWHFLVHRAKRPTILLGLLAVVLTMIGALLLVFLLDQVGGRLLLSVLSISGRGNLEVDGVISNVWMTAISQIAWFLLPCLWIGALLAWWQEKLWLKQTQRGPGIHFV
jgi:hypothetical protein